MANLWDVTKEVIEALKNNVAAANEMVAFYGRSERLDANAVAAIVSGLENADDYLYTINNSSESFRKQFDVCSFITTLYKKEGIEVKVGRVLVETSLRCALVDTLKI